MLYASLQVEVDISAQSARVARPACKVAIVRFNCSLSDYIALLQMDLDNATAVPAARLNARKALGLSIGATLPKLSLSIPAGQS
jgi:hypothetical protein